MDDEEQAIGETQEFLLMAVSTRDFCQEKVNNNQ